MKSRQQHHAKRVMQVFVLCAAALFRYAHGAPTGATADVLSPGTMLQFALGLGTVLALIVAAGWLMKKSAFGKSAPGIIKVVAGAAVGQRERVVVVEVDNVRMVLGVAPGRVTALHTILLASPPGDESDKPGAAPVLTAALEDEKDDDDAENAAAAAKLKAWIEAQKTAAADDAAATVKPEVRTPAPRAQAPGEDAGAAAKLKAWLKENKESRDAR
jgi:flagellar biosynthetic protein FliO